MRWDGCYTGESPFVRDPRLPLSWVVSNPLTPRKLGQHPCVLSFGRGHRVLKHFRGGQRQLGLELKGINWSQSQRLRDEVFSCMTLEGVGAGKKAATHPARCLRR